MPGAQAPAALPPVTTGVWRPAQIYALVLLTLVVTLNYIDRAILSVLQETIKTDLKLSDTELGLLAGPAFGILYALSSIPAARLADRSSRPTILAVMVGLWSGMTALCGTAATVTQLVIYRLGVGMGEGGCMPISVSIVAEKFHVTQRGLALAFLQSGRAIAAVTTPLVAAWIATAYGWRMVFIVLGIPGLIVALLVFFTLSDKREAPVAGTPKASRAGFLADVRFLFSNRAYTYLFFMAVIAMISGSGTGTFEVSYLVRAVGLSLPEAAGVLSAAGALGLIGAYACGYLADRFADERGRSYVLVPAIAAVLAMICNCIAFSKVSVPLITTMLIAAGFFSSATGAIYAALQNITIPRLRATAIAVHMLGATVIGGSLGPLLSGMTSDFLASQLYSGPSTYAAACAGGRTAAGAAHLAASCLDASSEGLRSALFIFSLLAVGAVGCMMMASRYIRINELDEPSPPAGPPTLSTAA